jgi:peptidoglycan/xylan/chitin deacetylase (PgdA/CDA1 family)
VATRLRQDFSPLAPTRSPLRVLLVSVTVLAAVAGTSAAGASGRHGRLAGRPDSGRGTASPRTRFRAIGCQANGPALVFSHAQTHKRVVAFGFDDGPWSDTAAFVSMLARKHAVATFFMIGRQVTGRFRGTLRQMLRNGDALGDHSFTHPDLTRVGDVRAELVHTKQVISGLSGYTPCVFRPPYGAYDRQVVQTARSLGLVTVSWNVDPADWARPGATAIEQRVLAQVRPGSIVISHDGGGPRQQTLAAYSRIISVLRARGYRFETVPQLLGLHTVYHRCPVRGCPGGAVSAPLPPGSRVVG